MDPRSELEWFRQNAPSFAWHWASTFADGADHSYVMKGKHLDEEAYERAFRVVQTFGEPAKFYRRTNVELVLPDIEIMYGAPGAETLVRGIKFWHMSERLSVSKAFNMAPMDRVYGVQDAPLTHSPVKGVRDFQAATLIDRREETKSLERSRANALWNLVKPEGHLLDLGPRGGSTIEALRMRQDSRYYTAVSPVQAELNVLVWRHPWVRDIWPISGDRFITEAERVEKIGPFNRVVALLGEASYLTPDAVLALPRALAPGGRMVLMHYLPGQTEDYFGELDLPATADASREAAKTLPGAEVRVSGGYQITIMEKR